MATKTKKSSPTTTRKRATKRTTRRPAKKQAVRSFRVSRPEQPFMTFSITRQTAYWLVLGLIVVAFGLWINKLQSDINAIYDSIDANNATLNYETVPQKKQ